jgi:hypothetical protein
MVSALLSAALGEPFAVRGVNAMSEQTGGAQPPQPIDKVYEQALIASGYQYLEREAELRERSSEALPFLRRRQAEAQDSFDRFAAATLADWIQGKPREEYGAVMAELQAIDERLKPTPAGGIRADVAESTMTRMAGDRLTDILALRLAANALTPPWKERGALNYLFRHAKPSTLPALQSYAQRTQDPTARSFALKTVSKIKAQ